MLGTWWLLWVSLCLLFFLLRIRRPKNFPPGPQALPVFGNLLQLNLKNPLHDLEKLSVRYGNVFSLYLGSKPAVVVNGHHAMKEAMVTRSVDFAGRPQGTFISHISEGNGVILVDYGHKWREHRRFALTTLRNFGLGKRSMEERILEEISHLTRCLEESAGSCINPQTIFHKTASNIICTILFGNRYDHEDKLLKVIIEKFTENSKIANGPWTMIYDSFPILRIMPLPFKKAFDNRDTLKEIAMKFLSESKKTRVPGDPQHLLDCYMDELAKRQDDEAFSETQCIGFVLDLFFAGTDTTSNTLLTGFLYLMTNPDIQERCQQEIDAVLEGKPHASYEDRHQMPYVQAMIHEVQRVGNTVPLSVFHSTTKDTELMGYDIPKGTMIIQNLTTVLFEESQWKFPHEFNPSNFLNEQGEFVKPEAFMPFSIGPRMCLGEGLARMELFLIMVTLLRRFEFVWPEDAGTPDYTPVFGVTMTPKPYKLGVRLRG